MLFIFSNSQLHLSIRNIKTVYFINKTPSTLFKTAFSCVLKILHHMYFVPFTRRIIIASHALPSFGNEWCRCDVGAGRLKESPGSVGCKTVKASKGKLLPAFPQFKRPLKAHKLSRDAAFYNMLFTLKIKILQL